MKSRKTVLLKRPAAIYLLLCMLFAVTAARIAYIQKNLSSAAVQTERRYIEIARSRGYIYDRAGRPLVNDAVTNVAAFLVNDQTRAFLPEENRGAPREPYRGGVCVTVKGGRRVEESDFSMNLNEIVRYGDKHLCRHVIGYLDASGHGVCGIEKSFDRILSEAGGRLGVSYAANALGQAIAGEKLKTVNERYNNPAGVALTIDRAAQTAVQNAFAAGGITRGAAVVLEVDTGAIAAMASVPVYDMDHMDRSLKDEGLPFLNRALAAYPVGSVFKPFVAAAALENNVALPENYDCFGEINVQGVAFHCYRHTAHGKLDLSGAIGKSCNCYFISLAEKTGAQAVCKTAAAFGFGAENRLTGDLIGAAGNVPDLNALGSPAALANLSFGQGDLLASPLQLAAADAALANGGAYNAPYLLRALIDENGEEYARYKPEEGCRALSAEAAAAVNACLHENMMQGTGKNGASDLIPSAGKTATAQTGDYASGDERLCTWFCGFFPYGSPEYAVVVLNENGESASEDCAPVFRAITEGMLASGMCEQ